MVVDRHRVVRRDGVATREREQLTEPHACGEHAPHDVGQVEPHLSTRTEAPAGRIHSPNLRELLELTQQIGTLHGFQRMRPALFATREATDLAGFAVMAPWRVAYPHTPASTLRTLFAVS
jgi:hypothetical protein